MMDDRGATEVLGFILAFAIITAAIGIVYSSGVGGLQDMRDDEQLKNVERAFDVLAHNLEGVRRYGVPSRSTEIRLQDGRIVYGPSSRVNVSITGRSFNVTTNMRPITYVSNDEDTQITYVGGAVFRTSEGQSIMLSEPGWIVNESDRLVVPIAVTYRQIGPSSLSTAGTALVVSRAEGRVLDRANSNTLMTVRVSINSTSARAGAWARYFQRTGFDQVGDGSDDGKITYELKVYNLRVVRSFIGLELSP